MIIIPAASKDRRRKDELASRKAFEPVLSWPNERSLSLLAISHFAPAHNHNGLFYLTILTDSAVRYNHPPSAQREGTEGWLDGWPLLLWHARGQGFDSRCLHHFR